MLAPGWPMHNVNLRKRIQKSWSNKEIRTNLLVETSYLRKYCRVVGGLRLLHLFAPLLLRIRFEVRVLRLNCVWESSLRRHLAAKSLFFSSCILDFSTRETWKFLPTLPRDFSPCAIYWDSGINTFIFKSSHFKVPLPKHWCPRSYHCRVHWLQDIYHKTSLMGDSRAVFRGRTNNSVIPTTQVYTHTAYD